MEATNLHMDAAGAHDSEGASVHSLGEGRRSQEDRALLSGQSRKLNDKRKRHPRHRGQNGRERGINLTERIASGKDMAAARADRGWSQDELAEMVGVDVKTIARQENGKAPIPEDQKAFWPSEMRAHYEGARSAHRRSVAAVGAAIPIEDRAQLLPESYGRMSQGLREAKAAGGLTQDNAAPVLHEVYVMQMHLKFIEEGVHRERIAAEAASDKEGVAHAACE